LLLRLSKLALNIGLQPDPIAVFRLAVFGHERRRRCGDEDVRKAPDLSYDRPILSTGSEQMSAPRIFFVEHIETPTGHMRLVTDDTQRLRALDWDDCDTRMRDLLNRHYGAGAVTLHRASHPSKAAQALRAYFDGDLDAIIELPTETNGTPFQRKVWAALRRIPAGHTVSYGALAAAIGQPKAVRAVGLANGANPIAIVVPCHRVIGANASLTGYGGGLHRKRWLLAHERGERPLFDESLQQAAR
jgi:methylated-DNA-[protein]-cysteine S-methyltransferase